MDSNHIDWAAVGDRFVALLEGAHDLALQHEEHVIIAVGGLVLVSLVKIIRRRM
jgi:hypothetical protein